MVLPIEAEFLRLNEGSESTPPGGSENGRARGSNGHVSVLTLPTASQTQKHPALRIACQVRAHPHVRLLWSGYLSLLVQAEPSGGAAHYCNWAVWAGAFRPRHVHPRLWCVVLGGVGGWLPSPPRSPPPVVCGVGRCGRVPSLPPHSPHC